MSERLTGHRRAGEQGHPAGTARRPQLVLLEGGLSADNDGKDTPRRGCLRRVVEFVTDGLATLPEQHFG